jgi:hypothetical protein
MCQDNFKAEGKNSYHILELLYGPSNCRSANGARLSYSRRQENRRQAREEIKNRWAVESPDIKKEEWAETELVISVEVLRIMEERMILYRDLQRVVFEAEKTGRKIFNPETARYTASLKPGVVTYWVEYFPDGDHMKIYNAYSHRLEVMEMQGEN